MQEASTVGDVSRSMAKINVALDDQQVEFQPTMIECEGKISKQLIFVLFHPRDSLSYVSLKVVDECHLQSSKFSKPWLVQLAIGTKRRVTTKTECCPITILGQSIHIDLNILPLGSYDELIGMDWLERCQSLVDSKQKIVSFIDQLGQRKELQGIKTNTKISYIIASQLRECIKKCCQVYVV